MSRAQALVEVAGENVRPELKRPLHQLAVQEEGLGAEVDVAEVGRRIIDIGFDPAVRHFDEEAEVAGGDFLIERQLVVVHGVLGLGGPFGADPGPEKLSRIGEMVIEAVVPANARGRYRAGAVLEEGGVGLIEPARFVARIGAANAIVDAADEPAPDGVVIAPAAVLPAGDALAVGAAAAAAE